MIYIEELELIDFQTHKRTIIKFDPHFNVMVGSTRSGKSSVVRALDFLLYNNWYEDYQRFDTKETTVNAKLSNGRLLSRIKSSHINKASITDGTNTQRFEAFGTSLPAEIIATMGVIPIEIGNKDPILANVANQDDPLFLLYATGTDRTKVLSRLSGLHWLDYALKDLNADRRTKSGETQFLQDANVQLLTKLKSFENIEDLKSALLLVQRSFTRIKKVATLVHASRVLLNKTAQWKKDYQEVQDLKTINFSVECNRLEKLIYIQSEVLHPLQDLSRKLITNTQSLENTKTYQRTLDSSKATIEKQLAEELTKVPICSECGQEIKQRV